jgi:hypothetical protein
MNHGGISRRTTLCFIDLAQGRASSYVSNDIGAMLPGRWQAWQFFWRIGATSFVNVTWVCPVTDCPAFIGDVATMMTTASDIGRMNRIPLPPWKTVGPILPH